MLLFGGDFAFINKSVKVTQPDISLFQITDNLIKTIENFNKYTSGPNIRWLWSRSRAADRSESDNPGEPSAKLRRTAN